jgi:REP element-mobilizing transposase RayT
MARPIRIQYPGATYHVMARGTHGQEIFQDDQDRQRFLETLGEACEKTGFRIHAYVLMGNHYHLLVETPEGNLVAGMKWLQGAYTQRYNSRHKLFGHLFQGRYKAVPVEAEGSSYFEVVSTYIHLNPARGGLIRVGRERLKRYRWSSYAGYLSRRGQRPAWLVRERVLESLGLGPGEARGYEAYIEGRVLELGTKAGRKELAAEWKALRRGWYVGSESFLAKLEEHLEPAVKGRKRESLSGPAKAAHDEAGAEQLLEAGLRAIGLSERALAGLPKGAAPKVVLAWWVRQRTAVPLRWVSERLAMGHYTRVTQAVSRMNRRPGRKLQLLRRKLERLPTGRER